MSDVIQSTESRTTRHQTGCGALYVTIDILNGKPHEVFIQNTQCGCQSAINVIARCISARLQEGTDIETIVKPLRKPHCEECIKICAEGKSCWDIVAKELLRYTKPKEKSVTTERTAKLEKLSSEKIMKLKSPF